MARLARADGLGLGWRGSEGGGKKRECKKPQARNEVPA